MYSCTYCLSFGSSADPFSQDPALTGTPFQNEPKGKRNQIRLIPNSIKNGSQ